MKILITGAKGFVGQNLCASLREIQAGHDRRPDHVICANPADITLYLYGRNNTLAELEAFCADCDFVLHLAGVNRPKEEPEFMEGNFEFTSKVLDSLKEQGNTCPVLLSSSVQASLEDRYAGSAYGKSKRAGEELLFQYAQETGAKVLVYRLPNVFGKWCRPNYNSAVATFCHNTAHGLPIQVNDPATEMDLVYIDDVVEEMIQALRGRANREGAYCAVPVHHQTTLGHIADTIRSFPGLRESLEVPRLDDPLTKKLYSTYLSYLPAEKMIYDLKMNEDARGSFTELIRTPDRGQFSVNISKPGITKGQHWHHTKNEKFVVVKGTGLIQLRRIGLQSDGSAYPVEEFRISGNRFQVVEMIPGYTHNIINLSETEDLVTFMWASEPFDRGRPDTFFEEV
ncbi:MAG: capsular polysaccharide biosynthesis protein CapF [Oscillospiraceae bacterium]|nr:capsular polysaccharide biosynthesis protein CapF [Oscillospiraceae bacterium]